MEDQNNRIRQALKQGLPPENLELFQIDTESYTNAFFRIIREMNEAHEFRSKRLIALVGQRGFGKTHIFKMLQKHINTNSQGQIIAFIEFKQSLVENFNEISKSLGLTFFQSLKTEAMKFYNVESDEDLFSKLFAQTKQTMLSLAISKIDSKESALIWKWFTDRIGIREINKVSILNNRISRNLRNPDILELLIELANLCRIILKKSLVLVIDEVSLITNLSRKENQNIKHFLVEFINSSTVSSLFILLGCTSASWVELSQSMYSVNIGLARRLLSIELYGLISFDEANSIANKILTYYSSVNDVSINLENDTVVQIYDSINRNPGYFVKKIVELIEDQIIESKIFSMLPIGEKVRRKGEDAYNDFSLEKKEFIFWEFIKDTLKEYNTDITEENFSSFTVRSIRRSRDKIQPSFSCTLNEINFVAELKIKLDTGLSKIGINAVNPLISSLRYELINYGIIITIGNVLEEFTTGPRGAKEFLEENQDVKDQIHIISLSIDELKSILGFYVLKLENPEILSNISLINDITGNLYDKISNIQHNYSPTYDKVFIKQGISKLFTHVRFLEGLRNTNSGDRMDINELIKFISYSIRSEEIDIDQLVSVVKLRLSDLNQSSDHERIHAMKTATELFEFLVIKSREYLDTPRKAIISRRNATIGNILLAKCNNNDLTNHPDISHKIIDRNKFISILINFNWFDEFVFTFKKYSGYSSTDSLSDTNQKILLLIRNDFNSDFDFINRFSKSVLNESSRLFIFSSLCRNYLSHPNPQFCGISDISTFKDSFDLILTACLEFFAIGRKMNLFPYPFLSR